MPLGTEVGVGLRDIVLDGDPAPSPKGAQPKFSAIVRCGQTAGWTKILLGMEVGLGPGDFVFDGDPASPRKKGTHTPTQFLAHVYCGQTAGFMKTPLGTEVDLGTGHIVLDVSQLSSKGAQQLAPLFSPMSIVATVAHLSYC